VQSSEEEIGATETTRQKKRASQTGPNEDKKCGNVGLTEKAIRKTGRSSKISLLIKRKNERNDAVKRKNPEKGELAVASAGAPNLEETTAKSLYQIAGGL